MDVFAFILDLIFVLLSAEANIFPVLERPDKIKEKTEHLQRVLTGSNRTKHERIIPFLFTSPMPSAGPATGILIYESLPLNQNMKLTTTIATGLTVSIASKKRQLDPAELIEGKSGSNFVVHHSESAYFEFRLLGWSTVSILLLCGDP